MAMLVAWAFCNRGRIPADERFPAAVLVVCPNLTIKERLQVLRPEREGNYFEAFDLVPSTLLPELMKRPRPRHELAPFAPESPHAESGKTYTVVNKGDGEPGGVRQAVLGDLADRGPILVLNDEAHHAYRPAPVEDPPFGRRGEGRKRDRERPPSGWLGPRPDQRGDAAIELCVDLSATPFYIAGERLHGRIAIPLARQRLRAC